MRNSYERPVLFGSVRKQLPVPRLAYESGFLPFFGRERKSVLPPAVQRFFRHCSLSLPLPASRCAATSHARTCPHHRSRQPDDSPASLRTRVGGRKGNGE